MLLRPPLPSTSLCSDDDSHVIINDPCPSVRDLNPKVPPALENVVFRLMEKEPADRYNDAAQAERALDQVLKEPETTIRPPERERQKPAPTRQEAPSPPPPPRPSRPRAPVQPQEVRVPVPAWIWIAFVGILGGLGFLAYVMLFNQ